MQRGLTLLSLAALALPGPRGASALVLVPESAFARVAAAVVFRPVVPLRTAGSSRAFRVAPRRFLPAPNREEARRGSIMVY